MPARESSAVTYTPCKRLCRLIVNSRVTTSTRGARFLSFGIVD